MNATRTPTGGSGDDLETLLRSELGAVAQAVGDVGRPVPTSALLAHGRTARRRRQALLASGAAAVAVLALVVGTSLAPFRDRAVGPADPALVGPTLSAQRLAEWSASLPAGTADAAYRLPRSAQGVVRWAGREVTLPTLPGRDRFAVPFGETDRGLLLAWSGDRTADAQDFRMQVGWLSPDGRTWTQVETVMVTNAAVSTDGTLYAYTGKVRDSATQQVTHELVVRRVSDDGLVGRTTIRDDRYLLGWVLGRPALRDRLGTELFTYDARTVTEAGSILVRSSAPGHSSGEVVSIAGDTLQTVTGDCPQTEATGALSRYEAAAVRDGGRTFSQPIGCAPEGMQFVSPDGRWYVAAGDEATVRSLETGRPVGEPNPRGWPVGTVVVWEADSRHLQVVVQPDGSDTPTVLRCSADDGRCVRAS